MCCRVSRINHTAPQGSQAINWFARVINNGITFWPIWNDWDLTNTESYKGVDRKEGVGGGGGERSHPKHPVPSTLYFWPLPPFKPFFDCDCGFLFISPTSQVLRTPTAPPAHLSPASRPLFSHTPFPCLPSRRTTKGYCLKLFKNLFA